MMKSTNGLSRYLDAWRERRQLRRELDGMTDRELWELGFVRQDIPRILRGDRIR